MPSPDNTDGPATCTEGGGPLERRRGALTLTDVLATTTLIVLAWIAVLSLGHYNGDGVSLPTLIVWYAFLVYPLVFGLIFSRGQFRCANCYARQDKSKGVLPYWSVYLLMLAVYLGIIVLGIALR